MTAAVIRPSTSAGLLELLMSRVRPEFRTELVERRIGDPVLGEPACAVDGCDRAGHVRLLCRSHHHRWMVAGRPEMGRVRWFV